MSELIIKFCHPNRDVRPPSPSPPPPLLIMIFMIFIIFLMQTIIKIRHLNRDFEIPIVVAKIPIWLVAQVQVEEIVFMAVRNFKASLLPPPAPTGGCCSPLCVIVSYCQMMAMVGIAPKHYQGRQIALHNLDQTLDPVKHWWHLFSQLR